jgi:hypothetical protein
MERVRRNIYAIEAIELSGLGIALGLLGGLIGKTAPDAIEASFIVTFIAFIALACTSLLVMLFVWGLYLLQMKIMPRLPLGCLVVGVIVSSLAYGAGIVVVILISIFDLNRLILAKSLYLGDAPIEFFWSPASRIQYAEWKAKNKMAVIKQKIDILVEDVGRLIYVLQTGSSQEKTAAAEALGTLGDKRALEPLIAALQHKSLDLSIQSAGPKIPFRVAAATALGKLGDARAVEPLIAALQNTGVSPTISIFMYPVQAAAAAALGQLGDSRAIEPLTAAIQHKPLTSALERNYEEVRTAAVAALASGTSSTGTDEDDAFLQAEPISRKRMDLLWLDPPRLAQLQQPLAQRLADSAHPAREQLEQVVKIVDQYVQVELVGERTATKISAPVGEMERAVSVLDEAIAICPDDMDLFVAKACVLHASAQFKSAEEVLDIVLSKVPDHFEAKMWKSHWETWSDALRFPKWDERLSSLHPVMATHLRLDHRVQIVRDGMQKTLAIVTGVQGPPFDSRTEVKVEWVLSKTPYGPLVAYYPKIIEPSGEPSTLEAFLPMFQPTAFSPIEGYFLVQQLAFTPYCFVVLVSENTILLNRRIVFGQNTIQKVRDMASQLASAQSYLPQHKFQSAMQWHMNNYDMERLAFE